MARLKPKTESETPKAKEVRLPSEDAEDKLVADEDPETYDWDAFDAENSDEAEEKFESEDKDEL